MPPEVIRTLRTAFYRLKNARACHPRGQVIDASDITVSVPCLFESRDPIWLMDTTCKRFEYQLRPYGMGGTYAGWIDMKVNRLREQALSCPTSHILYSDARDAWFLAPPTEVADKYNYIGCPPILLSAQCDVFESYGKWYEGIKWNMNKVFRYIGTPGQLCEAKALADALGWMQEHYHVGEDENGLPDDDPAWWLEYIRAHPGTVTLDTDCRIFMNAGSYHADGMWENILEIKDARVHNKYTGQWPCVLHFNGGSSDALKGKWPDLEPFWRKLGYTQRPPWENK
jgi:hypothetical protein